MFRVMLSCILCLVPVFGGGAVFAQSSSSGYDGPVFGVPALYELFAETVKKHGRPERKPFGIRPKSAVPIGGTNTFWAMNVAQNSPVQVEATLRHIGKHCYIYLEIDMENRVSQETLEMLARRFDEEIYPTNHRFFGSEPTPGIDFDERITLLFLDIQDGWEPGKGYVAGYFSPMDTFSQKVWAYSNEREMFYMDINPADATSPDYLGILAHEFQHMIHFNYDPREELWLNEASSQIAFFVNHFGHAPQILSFLQAPDTQIDEFNNGIDDYGSVYLFLYYLMTKYMGGLENSADLMRDVVASKSKGLESINEVFQKHGVSVTTDEIIPDWLLANYINDPALDGGRYSYDDTLPIHVQPTTVFAFDNLPAKYEGTVNMRAANFVLLTDKIRYLPVNPTLVDKIRIYSNYAAEVRWNINGGKEPPAAFVPEGAKIENGFVVMATAQDDEGRHYVEVGPFVRGGVRVTEVSYALHSENAEIKGSIPVYSFQTSRSLLPQRNQKYTISFKGQEKGWFKDRKFLLKKYTVLANGQKSVTDIALDKKNSAVWTEDFSQVREITIVPISTVGGQLKYELIFQPAGERDVRFARGLVDEWQSEPEQFLQRLIAEPELLNALRQEWDRLSTNLKARLAPDFRKLLQRFRFQFMENNSGSELEKAVQESLSSQAPVAPGTLDSDQDTAHDNIEYLISKAKEGVHALSHLKIDPNFIEGQLIETYKLLELLKGFPHLPLPDGLAIVNYDVRELEVLLNDWAVNGGKQHHEVLRRMALAQQMILSTYNDGLVLAEDASLCMLDLVSFFMQAKFAISTLLDPIIQNGGFTGKLAGNIKKKIHAKIVQIFSKVVALVSVRLPSPYNTIVGIGSSVVTVIYTKIFDLQLESQGNGWMKTFAVKTLGKYAFMSVPSIGIVPLGNRNVDYLLEQTKKMEVSGNIGDAEEDTRTKLFAVSQAVSETHTATDQKRKYAEIAKYVTQLGGLTSTIDPTNISRIVTLLSTVTGTGLLAHSIYDSVNELYKIPGQLPGMIDASFKPYGGNTVDAMVMAEARFEPKNRELVRAALQKSHNSFLTLLQKSAQVNNHDFLREYAVAEEEYDAALKLEEMLMLAEGQDASELLLELTDNSFLRSRLEVELLLEDGEAVRNTVELLRGREEKTMQRLLSRSTQPIFPIVSAALSSLQQNDETMQINLEVQSFGDVNGAVLRLFCADELLLEQDSFVIDDNTRNIVIIGGKKDLAKRGGTIHAIFETPQGVKSYPLTIAY